MYKALDEVASPAEMRAALERYARDFGDWTKQTVADMRIPCPLVKQALDIANARRMSPEDKYSMLAYHAVAEVIRTQNERLKLIDLLPAPGTPS